MNVTSENILLVGSLLLFVSLLLGKPSYKYGVPVLLMFLVIGMLAGSEGILGIYFDNPKIAQFIGVVSLNIILFSGGLDTHWKTIQPVLWKGISLSTLGVLFTALMVGIFVHLITELTIYESLLLGAIVSSTDAAAVFSILRSKNLALKSNLRPTLELESGSNDPMAYVLTIAFLSLVTHQNQSILSIIPLFLQQMILGALAGFIFGKISLYIINKIQFAFEGLYPVLVIALMFITFSSTSYIKGNGFLAIYICAVYLGNHDFVHKNTVLKMYDGLAWLMQIVLFLTLGLLVFPSHIVPFIGLGLLISTFLIIVARPISVFLSLLPFKMRARQRFFVSWVGLRGAVPIVFATYPLLAGIEKAEMIFNIVFFISVTSVLIQGTTLSKMAKWLRVSLPEKLKPLSPVEALTTNYPKTVMEEITILSGNYAIGRKILEIGLPVNTLVTMIIRNDKYFIPNGSTIIKASDKLILLSNTQNEIKEAKETIKNKDNS
jgi:cell volume regulation protein A